MLAVEVACRAYARKFGADEELWGLVGLLHDFDYERWPNPPDHPLQGAEILRARGYSDEVIDAIKSHADYLPACPRVTPLQKTLYACDELCGFLVALSYVRPERLANLTASSVRKKMKSKGFAAGVKREDLLSGAADLGIDFDVHVEFVAAALHAQSAALGILPPESTPPADSTSVALD